jgi:hypothetical protein
VLDRVLLLRGDAELERVVVARGHDDVRFDSVPLRVAQMFCGLSVVPANQRRCS